MSCVPLPWWTSMSTTATRVSFGEQTVVIGRAGEPHEPRDVRADARHLRHHDHARTVAGHVHHLRHPFRERVKIYR